MRKENPWTAIPPDDYDRHMSHPAVNQQAFLSECLRTSLREHRPRKVLIIGCGTGNGLEHINPAETEKITVADINADFLQRLVQRFRKNLPGLETVLGDLQKMEFEEETYDMVYAGLVFEFIEPRIVLQKVSRALRAGGLLQAVLQIRNEDLPAVSGTGIDSIKRLKSILNLIDPPDFTAMSAEAGLALADSSVITLESGKSFFCGSYRKSGI